MSPSLKIPLSAVAVVLLAVSCENSDSPNATTSASGTASGKTARTVPPVIKSNGPSEGETKTSEPADGSDPVDPSREDPAKTGDVPTVHGFRIGGDEPGDAKKLLEDGTSFQKKGKYSEAIGVLSQALTTKSSVSVRAETLVELAETFFRRGKAAQEDKLADDQQADPTESLTIGADLFDEAVRLFPEVTNFAAIASYMAGSSYLLLGDQRIALDRYTRTHKAYGDTKQGPKALLRRGVCTAGLGDKAAALALFQEYKKTHAANPDLSSTIRKVNKYIYELGLVGRVAPALKADGWVRGVMPNGLRDVLGEVVVLTFFMTGCGHCKSEMPKIRRDIQTWTDRGVVFVGSSDPIHREAQAPIDSYIAQYGVKFFDVCIDRGGKSERSFRVGGYPAVVLIDRKGIVRWRGHYAFLPYNLIETLLAESL